MESRELELRYLKMVMKTKQAILKLAIKLPPLLRGCTAQEMEKIINREI